MSSGTVEGAGTPDTGKPPKRLPGGRLWGQAIAVRRAARERKGNLTRPKVAQLQAHGKNQPCARPNAKPHHHPRSKKGRREKVLSC